MMHEYSQLRFGAGFKPIPAALYYAQRLVPWPGMRRGIARALAAGVRHRHGLQPLQPAVPSTVSFGAEHLAQLEQNGLVRLDGLTPRHVVDEIRAHLAGEPVILPNGTRCSLEQLPAGTSLAAYSLTTALRCPAVTQLINQASVLDLVTRYLGCKPTLSSLGIRWSFPSGKASYAVQNYHRDPDDWRFLKFFVYLTDVDEEAGPHVFVRKSHKTAGAWRSRSYSEAEVQRRHGQAAAQAILGPAGISFLADTYGIHRGAVPLTKPRLILQAQYSILPVFSFKYEPVEGIAASAVDPYINRLLLAQAGAA